MTFRTEIPISKTKNPIDYNSTIVSLGSCFAVNIAEKLDYLKFDSAVNPFGILFHPLALERFIGFAINNKVFTDSDVFFHNERWHCFHSHSDLSHSDKETLINTLNKRTESTNQKIHKSTHIIITLGTAWVYRDNVSQTVVANCHKLPHNQFKKELLSVRTISESIQNTIELIKSRNPAVQLIFTISPVRHIKDGFVENQQSKSHLITALNQTLQTINCNPNAAYFPSYEIMMDELRDYRFYSEDMLHPNQTAIDFIWKRFCDTWILETEFTIMDKVQGIQKGLAHRPFNEASKSHQNFLSKLQANISEIQKDFPHIIF